MIVTVDYYQTIGTKEAVNVKYASVRRGSLVKPIIISILIGILLIVGLAEAMGDSYISHHKDNGEISSLLIAPIAPTAPRSTTVVLLGIGLVGLAGADVRRRWKMKAVDKSQVTIY